MTFLFISLQFLKSSTMATWGALFRHEALSKDAVVVEMAVKFLRASMTNLVKVRSRWQQYYSQCDLKPNKVLITFICLPLLRLGSRLETITQAASTPVWTLTVMRTSTLFLIVSTGDSSFASVVLTLLFCAYFYGFHCFFWCFAAFRAQQGEVLRSACRIVPLEAFRIGAEWLQYQITSPIDTGDTACK